MGSSPFARTFFWRSRIISPVSFFAPAGGVRDNRSGPRGFVPLCHCVTSPEGERKRLPPFRSLARYQEVEEYVPGLFFAPARRVRDNRSGPRGFVPLCHCVTSPEGERKRLSPFRSLARYLEVEECSPVSFFAPASEVRDNRSGPRGFVPLCHCVTSPEGERKSLPPFRSLARFLEIEECSPVSFFCARGWSSGQSLRASRFRTPLSLRDISRGRTETSVAVSVARTLSRGRGVFPGLFFLRPRVKCGTIAQGLAVSYPSVTA